MARSLVFDIFAIDRASHVFRHVGDEADRMGAKFGIVGKAIGVGIAGLATAAATATVVGVESVKMAANFESAIMRLTTTAGESPKNLKMVGDGLLAMSGQVGYSAQELAQAMYMVESGGFHGAAGLKVMGDAAKAAKVENANAVDVAKALTGALNDYKGTNLTSAEAANVLTAAVGHGMMTFQDLAEALPHIGSRAAAAGVTFEELTGALATMTQDGLPASVAATYLGQTIGQLAAPTAKARDEMKSLGLNATDVSRTLISGSGHGLIDAVRMLDDAITNHLTPSGLVAVEAFKKSNGTMSDFQKLVANLPPGMQTTVQAIATMAGGVKGMQGMLLLGGKHLGQFAGNVKAMRDQVKAGGKDIAGFAEQQQTLNGKLADAKGAWSALMITLGNYLLPVAKQVLDWFNRSIPAIETWVSSVVKKATPAIQAFSDWFKHELMPALDKAATQIIPALQDAWKTITANLGTGTGTWKEYGHFLTQDLIPTLTLLARVAIPAVATALHGLLLSVELTYLQFEVFKAQALVMSVMVLGAFSKLEAGWGGLLIALSNVPGFGWARAAGTAMINAATAAGVLEKALLGIKSPPAIDIRVNAYGTSAIANAIISGNAPLANSMLQANRYSSGGAYTTTSTGSARINGGMRAGGGPVLPGVTYRVGEEGPEDVTFAAPGYVHDARTTKSASHGAALHIENYYEAKAPVGQIAADLMFRMAHS